MNERHGHIALHQMKVQEDDKGLRATGTWGGAERAGSVEAEEKAQGDIINMWKYPTGGVKTSHSSQWCPVTGWRAMGTNWNTGVPLNYKKNIFYCGSDQALDEVAVSILGCIQNLTGRGPDQPALVHPALSRGLDSMMSPGAPANPNHSVTLWMCMRKWKFFSLGILFCHSEKSLALAANRCVLKFPALYNFVPWPFWLTGLFLCPIHSVKYEIPPVWKSLMCSGDEKEWGGR